MRCDNCGHEWCRFKVQEIGHDDAYWVFCDVTCMIEYVKNHAERFE